MKTDTTDKATPRPWKAAFGITTAGTPVLVELDGSLIASCFNKPIENSEANAELIVRAVNEHAALCAVAEAAKVIVDRHNFKPDWCNTTDGNGQTNYRQREVNEYFEAESNLAAVRKNK